MARDHHRRGDDNYPPFEVVDEDGGYNGFNVDLVYALSNELGLRIYLRPMPWAQAFAALGTGEVKWTPRFGQ